MSAPVATNAAQPHATQQQQQQQQQPRKTQPASAPPPASRMPSTPGPHNNVHPTVNGTHPPQQRAKKRHEPPPVDPAQMYETLKSKIASLEEDEVLQEEEERQFAEEAQTSVKGMEENAIHAKYIELFAELKRVERDHAKEKQKLVKDKDTTKTLLTKANQTKTKMENLARELQKDNKRLREDSKRLAQCVEDAQEELTQMKADLAKRASKAKAQDTKYRDMPDIVVKVVCRYRAELFFKISRKTKLSRLFNSWTDRMESGVAASSSSSGGGGGGNTKKSAGGTEVKKAGEAAAATATGAAGGGGGTPMQFVFTHNGRSLDAEQSPEDAGMDDGDEILAVEMMDLTTSSGLEDVDELTEPKRQKLKKNWTEDPLEAKRSIEELFDGVVRERLKDVLRQYELRERHFECVVRSKELEVLLSRARAAEQKQLAEGERGRVEKQQNEISQLRQDLDKVQTSQTKLIDKLIACCSEPNAERTQRLFASLRDELEKRGVTKLGDVMGSVAATTATTAAAGGSANAPVKVAADGPGGG